MNWKVISENCLSSDEGYLMRRYATGDAWQYVYAARTPAPDSKILYSGYFSGSAKAACVRHLKSTVGEAA